MENLLTAALASAESTVQMQVYNTANQTVLDTANKVEGNSSIKVTFLASNTFTALYHSNNKLGGVKGGLKYTFSVHTKTTDTAVTWRARVYFYDKDGVSLGSFYGAYQASRTEWTRLFVTGLAPTGAVSFYVELDLQNVYNGFSVWWDKAQMEQSDYPTVWVEAGTTKEEYAKPLFELLKYEWKPTDYYNYEDLNRIEEAVYLVAYKATQLGRIFSLSNCIFDRNMSSVEFADSLNRIENNIRILGDSLNEPQGFISPRTDWSYNSSFSFNDANRLKHNLILLYNYALQNVGYWKYAGAYIVGDEGVV